MAGLLLDTTSLPTRREDDGLHKHTSHSKPTTQSMDYLNLLPNELNDGGIINLTRLAFPREEKMMDYTQTTS